MVAEAKAGEEAVVAEGEGEEAAVAEEAAAVAGEAAAVGSAVPTAVHCRET